MALLAEELVEEKIDPNDRNELCQRGYSSGIVGKLPRPNPW